MNRLKKIPRKYLPLIAVEGVLKMLAGWKAFKNRQWIWLIALVVCNTAGILPLLYLFRFQRRPPIAQP